MWRNWQTHLTQNQADIIRAGSSPATGMSSSRISLIRDGVFFLKGTNHKLIGENAISHPFHPLLLSEKGHAHAACSVDKRPHDGFGSLTTFFGNKAVAEVRRQAKVSRVFHLFATAFSFKKTNHKLIRENAISHPFHPLLLSEKGHAHAACSVDKRPHDGFSSLTTFFGNKAVAEIRRPAKSKSRISLIRDGVFFYL